MRMRQGAFVSSARARMRIRMGMRCGTTGDMFTRSFVLPQG